MDVAAPLRYGIHSQQCLTTPGPSRTPSVHGSVTRRAASILQRYESPIFCPIEEDYNVPLIIGGPGVPAGKVVDTVTTHIDLAPTFFEMLGIDLRDDFDGAPIPLTETQISAASTTDAANAEHIDMEYWGPLNSRNEGNFGSIQLVNNTYKSARVIGEGHNLFYTVSRDNSRNLYVRHEYPYQMTDLFTGHIASALGVSTVAEGSSPVARDDSNHIWSHARRRLGPASKRASVTDDIPQFAARLNSLTMVLKSCKTDACRKPWNVLHPHGNVENLADATGSQFDDFYASQPKVSFSECMYGYIFEKKGPQDVIPFPG